MLISSGERVPQLAARLSAQVQPCRGRHLADMQLLSQRTHPSPAPCRWQSTWGTAWSGTAPPAPAAGTCAPINQKTTQAWWHHLSQVLPLKASVTQHGVETAAPPSATTSRTPADRPGNSKREKCIASCSAPANHKGDGLAHAGPHPHQRRARHLRQTSRRGADGAVQLLSQLYRLCNNSVVSLQVHSRGTCEHCLPWHHC